MDLEELETHFRFGDNWQSYARIITEGHVRHAVGGLRELLLDGCASETFLEIGCGSGIHSLAASILGAEVVAVDIDPASVKATHSVLASHGFSAVAPSKSAFSILSRRPRGDSTSSIHGGCCITQETCGAQCRRQLIWFALAVDWSWRFTTRHHFAAFGGWRRLGIARRPKLANDARALYT